MFAFASVCSTCVASRFCVAACHATRRFSNSGETSVWPQWPGRRRSSGRGAVVFVPTTTPLMCVPGPPIGTALPAKISHKEICQQAASAVATLRSLPDEHDDASALRWLTIDFPPERSETRGGTLVSRFENNLNMCEKLLLELGASQSAMRSIGGVVNIRDNINPQGGGPYLDEDQVMVGFRARCSRLGGKIVSILINAGVDASTLKSVQELDNGSDTMILLNCGLEKLSFFDKMGFPKYLDNYQTAYYCKLFPSGVLLKCGGYPWAAFLVNEHGATLLEEYSERPAVYKVEEKIRLAALTG